MATGSIFVNNCTQAVRLLVETRFPEVWVEKRDGKNVVVFAMLEYPIKPLQS